MVEPSRSSARQRFVVEAARLFAERGYHATTVADIQLACGLTAGSGALYKHFASKEELLRAVVQTHAEAMTNGQASYRDELPDDPRAALEVIAQLMWASMRADRNAIRVLLRDLDEFPELLTEIWQGIRDNIYDEFARWLDTQHELGRITLPPAGAQTTSAVLLAALTYLPVIESLLGHTPGDVAPDDFAAGWVDHACRTLSI